MSEACSTHSRLTTWPLMSSPRMLPAWVRTSSASSASLTPPALPRPPTLHLGLDHDRVAGRLGLGHGLVDGVGHPALGDGDAVAGEVLLALVLEEIHRIRSSLSGAATLSVCEPVWCCDRSGARPSGARRPAGAAGVPALESGVHSALALVERLAQPVPDGRQRGAGGEDLGDARSFRTGMSAVGDDPAHQHQHIVAALLPEPVDHPGDQREVGPGEQREADGVGVLLDDRLDDLLGVWCSPV